MGRNNFQPLYGISEVLTLAASASQTLDFDLFDTFNFQLYIETDYAATGAVTGCTTVVKDGTGPADPAALKKSIPIVLGGSSTAKGFDSTGVSYTLNAPAINSGTPLSTNTKINVLTDQVGRWFRLIITNNDPTNTATIKLYADF